jgi:hypothetical protein
MVLVEAGAPRRSVSIALTRAIPLVFTSVLNNRVHLQIVCLLNVAHGVISFRFARSDMSILPRRVTETFPRAAEEPHMSEGLVRFMFGGLANQGAEIFCTAAGVTQVSAGCRRPHGGAKE